MDGNELLRPVVNQATADVRVFIGDREVSELKSLDRTHREAMDSLVEAWCEEARRPTVRLRRAWRALRGR